MLIKIEENYKNKGKEKEEEIELTNNDTRNTTEKGIGLRCDLNESFLKDDFHSGMLFENKANQWLTTKEAANFLRISSKCLLNLTSNGRIRYYKFGRRNRFLLSDLISQILAHPRGGNNGN